MNTNKIMKLVNNICSHNVSNICPHNGNEFSYAEELLNLIPMMKQNRNQLHIWEIPYAENEFIFIYFFFGDISQTHREFCLSVGMDNGKFIFSISEAITIGSSCELHELPKNYFLYVDCTMDKPIETKPMTERMSWNAKEKRWDAPMHTIYDILIREAAKCKAYCSDVIYDIDNINFALSIQEISTYHEGVFWIGFRDNGVDSKSAIDIRREHPEIYGENPYRVIYILRFEINTDDPTEGKVIFFEEGREIL